MKLSFLKPVALLALLFYVLCFYSSQAVAGPGGPKKSSLRKANKNLRNGTRTAYISSRFQELSRSHQVIALLPVEVHIDAPAANGQLTRRALVEAKNFYRVLFAYLQRENSTHASPLKLQDIAQTQRLLELHQLDAAAIRQLPPGQLATLLGVDAILFCDVNREARLVGEANLRDNLKRLSGFAGPSAGKATVHLYDGKTNAKLWQFEGLLTANLGKNMDQTILSLGSLVANQLPYY